MASRRSKNSAASPSTRSSDKRPLADTQPIAGGLARVFTVLQSTIEGNTAEEDVGGGIFVGVEPCEGEGIESSTHASTASPRRDLQLSDEEPRLSIVQSTIAKNQAGEIGGGIYEEARIEDPIVDSTITENFAAITGGGIAVGEGVEDLVSDTVSDNTVKPEAQSGAARAKWSSADGAAAAASGAGHDASENQIGRGSNLAADPEANAAIELRNTIVAETGSETNNCEGDVESLVPKAGYNLDYPSILSDESDTCGLSEEDHDLVGVKPELDTKGLQGNGGPTETIALLAASPAIGFVPMKEDCEAEGTGPALPNEQGKSTPVDQRGVERPGIPSRGCDIGAVRVPGANRPSNKNRRRKSTGAAGHRGDLRAGTQDLEPGAVCEQTRVHGPHPERQAVRDRLRGGEHRRHAQAHAHRQRAQDGDQPARATRKAPSRSRSSPTRPAGRRCAASASTTPATPNCPGTAPASVTSVPATPVGSPPCAPGERRRAGLPPRRRWQRPPAVRARARLPRVLLHVAATRCPALADAGWRALAPDLPGYGDSEPDPRAHGSTTWRRSSASCASWSSGRWRSSRTTGA